jgi:shikimate kinase
MTAAATLDVAQTEGTEEHSLPRNPNRVHLDLERIVLTGFMGSGKSTVGALLAEQLGWKFIDLDSEIERRCGMTIPAIFAELGEEHFRRQEASALASALGRAKTVIALGGGAPETLGNRLLLEQTPATAVVFLHAPFDVLHERCTQQAAQPGATARPVLADRTLAEARFNHRLRHYERIATIKLATTELGPVDATEAIVKELQARR